MGRHTTLSVFPCLHCRLRHPQLVTTWRHRPGLPWEKKSIPEGPKQLLRWRSPRAIGGDESPFLALMVEVSVASYLPLFLKNLRLVCRFTLHSSSYFFQGRLLMLMFSSWLQFVDKTNFLFLKNLETCTMHTCHLYWRTCLHFTIHSGSYFRLNISGLGCWCCFTSWLNFCSKPSFPLSNQTRRFQCS